MKVGSYTNTNDKGQLVIPKDIRKALGIDSSVTLNVTLSGRGIYIYPVQEFIARSGAESSYVDLLKKTQGSWADEDWDKLERKRAEVELKASEARKRQW